MFDLFTYNSDFSVAFNVFANFLVVCGLVTIGTFLWAVANKIHDWWIDVL